MRACLAAGLTALFAAGVAHAQPAAPPAPASNDAVATAPSHSDDPDTAAQIDAFVKSAPDPVRHTVAPNGLVAGADPASPWAMGLYSPLPYGMGEPGAFGFGPQALVAPNDGKVHGEVGGMIGTGGLRAGYADVVVPLSKDATLGLSVSETRYGRHY